MAKMFSLSRLRSTFILLYAMYYTFLRLGFQALDTEKSSFIKKHVFTF